MNRKTIPLDVKRQLLHDAGYVCSNPSCRTPYPEIHHLQPIVEGGSNDEANLLALCPTCHSNHHAGRIPIASLMVWKHRLLELNAAYDKAGVEALLLLHHANGLTLSGDGLLRIAGLIASGLAKVHVLTDGAKTGLGSQVRVDLTVRGRAYVDAWIAGQSLSFATDAPPAIPVA
jgi:hypothetical protein